MGTAAAVMALANMTGAALAILQNATAVSNLIQKKEAEKREFTEAEWSLITGMDDMAKQALELAILKALAHGLPPVA